MYEFTAKFDKYFLEIIRGCPLSLMPLMQAVTTLGNPAVVLAIFAGVALYGFKVSHWRLIQSSFVVAATIGLDSILKLIFHRARPNTQYVQDMLVQTFSFPSGHSCASMIGYGTLAYFALKLVPGIGGVVLAVLLVLLILAVGVSRVYLGAHYPSDVVAGWTVGLLGLMIIIFIIKPFSL